LRRHAKKIIYNYDDAVMYKPSKPETFSRSHFVPFRRSCRIADMIICGSEYLAGMARPYNHNVRVLPIGLKVSDYDCSPAGKNDGKVRLAWIGSPSTLCYLEGIAGVLEEIGSKTDNVLLRVICEEFPSFENLEVERCTWSAETRGTDLAACDIGLAPLPDESFTRGKCSFKVLEYSASGLAVVASPVGTNIDHVRDGVTGYLVNDASGWVERCMQLVASPDLRENMGREGRKLASQYDVEVIGKRFTGLVDECLNR